MATRKTMRKKYKKTMKKLSSPVKKRGTMKKAHLIFKAQALSNARKLFGYNITVS